MYLVRCRVGAETHIAVNTECLIIRIPFLLALLISNTSVSASSIPKNATYKIFSRQLRYRLIFLPQLLRHLIYKRIPVLLRLSIIRIVHFEFISLTSFLPSAPRKGHSTIPFSHSLSLFFARSPRNSRVLGCITPSSYGTPPSPLAEGSFTNTASPGARFDFTPGLHSSLPFSTIPFTAAVKPFVVFVFFCGLRRALGFSSSSDENASSSSSEVGEDEGGGEETALAISSS